MTAKNELMDKACQDLLDAFLEKHPNDGLRDRAHQALSSLLGRDMAMPGALGGWAGGIVYAVGSRGCGVPEVMNADLEKAFGTTMGTIRKRAGRLRTTWTSARPCPPPDKKAPHDTLAQSLEAGASGQADSGSASSSSLSLAPFPL